MKKIQPSKENVAVTPLPLQLPGRKGHFQELQFWAEFTQLR